MTRRFPLRTSLLTLAAAFGTVAISGCAAVQQTRAQQGDIAAQAVRQFEAAPTAGPVVQIDKGAWLLGQEVAPTAPKPALLNVPVVYASTDSPTLAALVQWIESNAGIDVVLDPSALSQAHTGTSGNATSITPVTASGLASPTVIPPVPAAFTLNNAALPSPALTDVPQSSTSMSAEQTALGPLRYSGPLSGFLDLIATRYGDFWHFKDGRVMIFKTETVSFELPELPPAFNINGSISSSGSSSASATTGALGNTTAVPTSSSSQGSQVSMTAGGTVDYWAGLQKIAQAVAGAGATVIVDRNFGLLTATGTPSQLHRVREWVKSLVTQMSKQVVVDVRLYNVAITREDTYGLNLALAYKSANGHTGIAISGASAPTISSTSTPVGFTASILGGTLSGTSVAVQALSTLGQVSQVTEVSGISRNGKYAGLQNASIHDYVSETQTTIQANAGAQTTMQKNTAVGGITGTFMPRVVGDQILIDFNLQLTDLLPFGSWSSNGSSVQLKNELQTTLLNSVALKSGQSLVMVGNRTRTAGVTNNGVGDPSMALLGGGVDAQRGDTILAVVITARLL